MGNISSFGSVSGVIGAGQFHAVEIKGRGIAYISEITASFRVPATETKATEPFLMGRVLVVKKALKNIEFSIDLFENISGSDVIFDQFFFDYDGFLKQFNQLKGEKDKELTVILFPGYLNSDPANAATLYASLNVLGTSTNANLSLETV